MSESQRRGYSVYIPCGKITLTSGHGTCWMKQPSGTCARGNPISSASNNKEHAIYHPTLRNVATQSLAVSSSRWMPLHAKARRAHAVEPPRYDVFAPSSGGATRRGAEPTPAHTRESSVGNLRRIAAVRVGVQERRRRRPAW